MTVNPMLATVNALRRQCEEITTVAGVIDENSRQLGGRSFVGAGGNAVDPLLRESNDPPDSHSISDGESSDRRNELGSEIFPQFKSPGVLSWFRDKTTERRNPRLVLLDCPDGTQTMVRAESYSAPEYAASTDDPEHSASISDMSSRVSNSSCCDEDDLIAETASDTYFGGADRFPSENRPTSETSQSSTFLASHNRNLDQCLQWLIKTAHESCGEDEQIGHADTFSETISTCSDEESPYTEINDDDTPCCATSQSAAGRIASLTGAQLSVIDFSDEQQEEGNKGSIPYLGIILGVASFIALACFTVLIILHVL